MRILIVDDDINRQRSLAEYIVAEGIATTDDIDKADCLDTARQRMRATYYDVLILDVVLPKRSGESADPQAGLSMLGSISRSALYKKPERIIGITAHVLDIERFRREFESYCVTLIEASSTDASWRKAIVNALGYTRSSQILRGVDPSNLNVVSIHGIQTFGGWQNRLRNLLRRHVGDVRCHSYKYGMFSIFALLLPPLRWIEVWRLKRQFKSLFASHPDATFTVFSHSFGTYLAAKALTGLVTTKTRVPVSTLVLSGSVLPQRFDWTALRLAGIRVVNDCADHDYILYLSQAFVLGAGMGGKCGFYGFHNGTGVNRFFLGGHSSYFDGDDFMERYWVPLVSSSTELCETDNRSHSVLRHLVLDKAMVVVGMIKPALYLSALWLFASSLLTTRSFV